MTEKGNDDYVIAAIPMTLIEIVWPQCVKHLQRVVDVANGEITIDSIKSKVLSGSALLITISDGPEIIAVNTMEVKTFDTGERAMFIPVVGGDNMDKWKDRFLNIAEAIAKEHGCNRLRGLAARRGWSRKLRDDGWEDVHMIIEKKI